MEAQRQERRRAYMKEYMRAYSRKYRRRLKAEGRCQRCMGPNNGAFIYCASCRSDREEFDKARRKDPKYLRRKQEYFSKRYKTDTQFRLGNLLRGRIGRAIKRGSKAGSAVRDLGCSIAEFKVYIESQFLPGMTWENWGRGNDKWNIDHIIPLASVDLTDREQFLRVCHYTNLRPLWWAENMRKGSRQPNAVKNR